MPGQHAARRLPRAGAELEQPRRAAAGGGRRLVLQPLVGRQLGPHELQVLVGVEVELAHQPQRREVGLEAGIGDGGRLHPDDLDAVARGQAGHGAEHRQPVVAVGLEHAAAQAARALDREAVLGRLDPRAEPAQPVDHGRDPVALLQPQLAGPAHHGLALGEAAEQRHQRQLVDRQRHLLGLDHGADQRAVADVELADRLLGRARRPTGSSSGPTTTPPMRRRMRKKPVRVQFAPMPSMTIRERGTSTAAAAWKAADDGSPGTCRAPSSSSSWAATVIAVAVAGDPHAGGGEHPLGVVAARLAARRPSSSPDASSPASSTHDLTCAEATGSSYSMPDSGPAGHRERREAALARLDRRAHQAERRGHAVDGAPADRGVAVERPAPALLPGQPAGQQPHQRAGVADVDQIGRRRRPQARRRARRASRGGARRARRAPARRPASSSCRRRRGSR